MSRKVLSAHEARNGASGAHPEKRVGWHGACRPVTRGGQVAMLCLVYLSWISGLVALVAHCDTVGTGLIGMALMCLVCVFFSLSGGRFMFSKKTTAVPPARPGEGHVNTGAAGTGLTVIGAGAVVEGNILRGESADIYGAFTGDICLPDGTVSIQPGGRVYGNICADSIIVGGEAEGCCEGKQVTILAQGKLSGICRSATFSITPGGLFIGTSERSDRGAKEPVSGLDDESIIPVYQQGAVGEVIADRDTGKEDEEV